MERGVSRLTLPKEGGEEGGLKERGREESDGESLEINGGSLR